LNAIGLPGFQFIQDEIEYETRTHHSNQDVFDRAQAMIETSVHHHCGVSLQHRMRDEKLPRRRVGPVGTVTVVTTSFATDDQVQRRLRMINPSSRPAAAEIG